MMPQRISFPALFCSLLFAAAADFLTAQTIVAQTPHAKEAARLVILKIDGLNEDRLQAAMSHTDPKTGLPVLPWFSRVFGQQGIVFKNFYTRGISLSAPSWSLLDTGKHAIIRGNAEYDRYTGQVYDYLNIFPFYVNYARQKQVDMPGVEVLDRAGIPLLIDRFTYPDRYQSFQLLQRGTRITTLRNVLGARFSSKSFLSMLENGDAPSLDQLWREQTEREIRAALADRSVQYVDFYTGDADHEGHATNDPDALLAVMKVLDGVVGRLWGEIQKSPLADNTIFVAVSDHGMNNVPGISSQTFDLVDLLNSPQGGAHHVVTNRHPLSDYKLIGLDPMVHRVVTPSTQSLYLKDQANAYPTAWLDLDGNERASIYLRNSDLNVLQILLQQLTRADLDRAVRSAAVAYFNDVVDRHHDHWSRLNTDLGAELVALRSAIKQRRSEIKMHSKKWSSEERAQGKDKAFRRLVQQMTDWQREVQQYSSYLQKLQALMNLQLPTNRTWGGNPKAYIPELALGDPNSVHMLQHYVVGPSSGGLKLFPSGELDEVQSFLHVDNFALLAAARARNNPQAAVSDKPIDFLVTALPAGTVPEARNAYWIYGDEANQLLVLEQADGQIRLQPVFGLQTNQSGAITWTKQPWKANLPLHLYEDEALRLPFHMDRGSWLSSWHSEKEWFEAIHRCTYSNGVLSIAEMFAPVGDKVPGRANLPPTLLRYERRRRELVQPDFEAFASDHWNFNIRTFNAGGNHGAFFRISTHSVWMMSGARLPHTNVDQPVDSLNFASTLLHLIGRPAPEPERVVNFPIY